MTKETIKVYRRLAEQVLVTLRGHELARICDALDAADLRIEEREEEARRDAGMRKATFKHRIGGD